MIRKHPDPNLTNSDPQHCPAAQPSASRVSPVPVGISKQSPRALWPLVNRAKSSKVFLPCRRNIGIMKFLQMKMYFGKYETSYSLCDISIFPLPPSYTFTSPPPHPAGPISFVIMEVHCTLYSILQYMMWIDIKIVFLY